jgi:EAL domain-containing protein (putative c-di-GMP-specific phosphodiesterase class I)/GGDEF domain-containing protein
MGMFGLFVLVGGAACGAPLSDASDVSALVGDQAQPIQLPIDALVSRAEPSEQGPAQAPAEAEPWVRQRLGARTLGFNHAGFWARTRLHNPTPEPREVWLMVADGYQDHVDCFVGTYTGAQAWEASPVSVVRTGDARPFRSRPLAFPGVVLPISLPAQAEADVRCLVRNNGSTAVLFTAWSPQAYALGEHRATVIRSMGYGAIAFTMLLALVMAMVNRHLMSVLLVAEMLPVLGAISGLIGDGFQTFWPDHPGWNVPPYGWVIVGLCAACMVLRTILQLQRGERWLLQVIVGVSGLLLLLAMVLPRQASVISAVVQSLSVVFSTFMLAISLHHWRDNAVAKLVGVGMSVQYVAFVINALGTLGLYHGAYQLGSLYASAFKALALAGALFYRVRLDRQERAQALAEHTKELEQRLSYEARLRHAASHHPRYGLPNQSILEEAIQAALPGERAGLSVCVLKLNRFGFLESILAPHTLTRLVKRFSGELEAWFADNRHARLLHIEGKQGLAALDDSTLAFVVKGEPEEWLLQELEALLTRRFEWEGLFVAWDPNVGISRVFEEQAQQVNLVVDEARITLQWCSGHSRILSFDADRMKREQLAYGLTLDLEGAIERGELLLHYQPKVKLSTGQTESLEALVRWQHPERGLIPPGAFIAEAEATGAINRLTSWAIGEAARFVCSLPQPGVRVSVNITAFDLATPRFVDRVLEILAQQACSPHRLILEVTESAALSDRERAMQILSALRQAGVCIALDDFGTGYSSLGILQDMPLDELKIDRSFVTGIAEQGRKQAVLRAMIEVGHSLGLQVTLEGVETEDSVRWLSRHGGDVVQGHVFSRPLAADAARAWMAAGPRPLIRPEPGSSLEPAGVAPPVQPHPAVDLPLSANPAGAAG